jgi:hypothetical protein
MFARYLRTDNERHPRDVAAWPGEAGDKPLLNRFEDINHDDGDRARGLLGRTYSRRTHGNEDVNLETN